MSFLGKTIGKIVGHSPSNKTETKASNASNTQQQSTQLDSNSQKIHQITYSTQYQQDAQLTLTHLRKVFFEYLHPKINQELTQTEKDEKLYSILPLFIKVNYFIIFFFTILIKI